MKFSGAKKHARSVSDVHIFQGNAVLRFRHWLKNRGRTINLKPLTRMSYPWRVVSVIALTFALAIGLSGFFARAEIADFYPATCLGSWVNVQGAAGEPDALETYGDTNSAVYNPTSSQIFCGGFVPQDYGEEGTIKNVGLTLVWRIGSEERSSTSESADVLSAVDSELPPVASSSEPVPPPVPDESVSSTTETTETPESISRIFEFKNFSRLLFTDVYAEEAEVVTENVAEVKPVSEEPLVLSPDAPPDVPPAAEENMGDGLDPEASGELVPSEPSAPDVAGTPEENIAGDLAEDADAIILGPPITAPMTPDEPSADAPVVASSTEEEMDTVLEYADVPDENFLALSYSVDGQQWIEIAKVNSENWQNLTITLPVQTWEDLKKLQIEIKGIPTSLANIPEAYLDGMFIEVHYEVPPVMFGSGDSLPAVSSVSEVPVLEPEIIIVPSEEVLGDGSREKTFRADQAPSFTIDINSMVDSVAPAPPALESSIMPAAPEPSPTPSPPSSLKKEGSKVLAWSNFILDLFRWNRKVIAQTNSVNSALPSAQNPVVARVATTERHATDIEPLVVMAGNSVDISVPELKRNFRPGKYYLQLWIYKNGTIYYNERDFYWGVLVVNFNKSIYASGNDIEVGFGVLTDQGHTVCDAHIHMEVLLPQGNVIRFDTRNNTIVRNTTCGPITVTNEPDYSASLYAGQVGTYAVTVSADMQDGKRTITDSFEVQNEPLFDVERLGPTRIYPPADYEMTLVIKANRDFAGHITETVPNSFQTIPETFADKSFEGDAQLLRWEVDMKAGETLRLSYSFKAPIISPELYKLGPLQIGSWREARQWQIAADAAGDVILLWDGPSIPVGWTCISCSAGDPFFGVFPRASTSYGAASSGVDAVTHTLTSPVDGGANQAGSGGNNGTALPTVTDTHTWPNATTTAIDIRPLYKNLKFISANNPSTLPNGIIGIFDVAATSSLPVDWSYYTAMDGRYLRGGENSTSTGGSATHQHNATSTITSGASTLSEGSSNKQTSATAAHTHTISSTAALTASDTNDPPFVTVVFAQLTTTSSIPNGLIAFFDNANLPQDWTSVSTSSPYLGNLLKGGNSFGAVGGTSTHSHTGSSTWVSSPAAGSAQTGNGGAGNAASNHTHNVTYTIGSGSSIPVNRYIVLGKYFVFSNSPPTVSAVVLNGGSAITLTPNTTTVITVVASTTDPEGPGDIRYATSTIYRSGVGAGCSSQNLNCYQITSSSCSFTDSTSTVSCSASIWYFAQATDSSSSFNGQTWKADITVHDALDATGSSSTPTGAILNTLLAINVTPATTTYGTVSPGTDTGSTNQTSTVQNAGNASTTLRLSGTALVFGSDIIATSSQHYATSTFTFGGNEQILTDIVTTVDGFLLTSPTSTTAVSSPTYWGITIPGGKPPGTYTGINVFTASFSP